ncbi:hypothetical protein F5J12DRAFT_782792 [Pisolithus orientalis]|uniref:uncharacterized protein n=1 Tax=Pisolithus orientalis TaxID=936130 RepID=UPI00222487E6|nr:uncharacterized protein F5J12DRAFT_782792 [Pisolithus orientalis]KAI6006503.1 hypothetical protein F5J12DRAFT_782792 [Pisolithus orientalis]
MQLSCLCSLALLSWITWTACWMMWVNNCLPIMMYCLQHLLNLRKVSYLQQWLPHQWHYLAILLDMEAPPEPRDCVLCGVDGIFQCIECAHQLVFCTMCCWAEHKPWPFHRVEQWNGTFFEKSSLQLAGLVLHVGHGGKHCPAGGCSNDEVTAEEEDDWEDLMQAGMFPATTKAARTAFTFQVLDDFIQDNVECGTSAMNFYSKLHHITSNAFPHLVPDRYRELLRVARMWWLLKLLKWQGSHTSAEDASPGELVLFCPACPQPGINIPEDEMDYSHWTLARSLVMDGNFKAEHMHPKDAGSKAWLMDGKGYMVTSQPYKEYLSGTKNVVEILDCSNHWAVNQANANQQQLASTGIGGCACAWHGCFVPHAMVDFQKGKQQVNMDYVLVHAIRHGTVPGQQICPGIGLWHVHGHCTECFAQYAPNFIVGAGQVDGEIMETLWSSLNIISPSARGMATPHQQEATARRLKWKLKVAEESYLVVEGRFTDLNGNVPLAISQSWGEEVAVALKNWLSRPQAMDIYEVRLQKGFVLSGIEAPSAKAVKIDLLAIPQPGHLQGMVTWIVKALKIEEAQTQLTVACQHITSRVTEAQNLTIACCHDHLQSHIHGIFDTAKKLFGDRFKDAKLCWSSNLHDPETIALLLPSNLQLQQGQANDCLHELQLVLAEKAVIFQTDIHHGSNYHMATHAWGRVANAKAVVQCHATVYCWCCIQMGSMALSDPNARGHRDDTLPWIWTMDVPRDMATNDWMSEFYRVNWLWTRALWDRWKEEVQLLKCRILDWQKGCCIGKETGQAGMLCHMAMPDIWQISMSSVNHFHLETTSYLQQHHFWDLPNDARVMDHILYDISSFMLYLRIRFHHLVTTMKKPDWSEYQHTSWYQHFLAEANNSSKVELGYERRPLWNIITEAAEFFTGVSNGSILLPLLINSHPSPTAEHAALHMMCTEGLKDIDQELSYLSKLILHSQEQMSSLEAVT